MEKIAENRLNYSIIFSIVVVILMVIVDKFLIKREGSIIQEMGWAFYIGKKFLDFIVGFIIGYFILFKPKKEY